MINQFAKYLLEIKFPETFYDRISKTLEFYSQFGKVEIQRIFVTDYINSEGERIFENLWLFSNNNRVMESKNFLTENDFDMYILSVRTWRIRFSEWDFFEEPTDKSRMHLKFYFTDDATGEFKATKENCKYLKQVAETYLMNIL